MCQWKSLLPDIQFFSGRKEDLQVSLTRCLCDGSRQSTLGIFVQCQNSTYYSHSFSFKSRHCYPMILKVELLASTHIKNSVIMTLCKFNKCFQHHEHSSPVEKVFWVRGIMISSAMCSLIVSILGFKVLRSWLPNYCYFSDQ